MEGSFSPAAADGPRKALRRIEIVFTGEADWGEQRIAPGIGEGDSHVRCGAAVSLDEQTGQDDEIHSPEACARRVVRRIWPVGSILVLWMVAISCRPGPSRTISRPLARDA
jgi:hypothetical protein